MDRRFAATFALTASLTALAAAATTAVWSWLFSGHPQVDWGTVVVLALAVGLALPLTDGLWRYLHERRAGRSNQP